MRRFLPELIDLVWRRKVQPGKVFDLSLPLDQVAEGSACHSSTTLAVAVRIAAPLSAKKFSSSVSTSSVVTNRA